MINQATSESPHPATDGAQTQRRRFLRPLLAALLFAAGVLAAFGGLRLYDRYAQSPQPVTLAQVEDSVDALLAEATPGPAHSVQVYDVILPSLVVIRINDFGPPGDSTASLAQPALQAFQPVRHDAAQSANTPVQRQPQIGSGVIVSADGLILTAYHVVERAAAIDITFADGTEAKAAIVALVPDNNIAVLQPDMLPETFAPATLGNPGALRIGDDVYAVGNPLGLAGSITSGIVSGLDRTYSRYAGTPLERLIQFDSAVNVGSGGGPLLNRNGEVVGIVVGPVNPTAQETFIGIGFAVRIDVAGSAAGAPEL